jgi:nicotinamidase-related amidase
VTFVALSALDLGYEAYAVGDASGAFSSMAADLAMLRMVQAGVIPMTWFAVGCELLMDWRHQEGSDFADILHDYLPFYGDLIESYNVHSKLNLN